jgi:hypothetical protein
MVRLEVKRTTIEGERVCNGMIRDGIYHFNLFVSNNPKTRHIILVRTYDVFWVSHNILHSYRLNGVFPLLNHPAPAASA